MRQTSFSFIRNYKKEFGGSLLKGVRKTKRPLSTKHPIHLILKSCEPNLFNPGNRALEKTIRATARRFNVKLFDLTFNWSHIHSVIQIKDAEDYRAFIRAVTSLISALVKKNKPNLKTIFTLRPFTRVISWGRELKSVMNYQILNKMEAMGFGRQDKSNKRTRKEVSRNKKRVLC
jgi:REP element-mobilizing transposase RayT